MRIHRVTHPVVGVASWKEIEAARRAVSKSRGFKICSWCFQQILAVGNRTRCGSETCGEMLHRAQRFNYVRSIVLRRDRRCRKCGVERSMEADHVVPVSLGGTGDVGNLRGLCVECHKEATRLLRKMGKAYRAV